jgi:glycosyltransferase involved in cell wall biosynthesis
VRIAILSDIYAPSRTSAAVQLRDLAREFARHGHDVVVIVPAGESEAKPWSREDVDGVEVWRLRAPRTKGVGYVRRTLNEIALPFFMLRNLLRSPLALRRFDGIAWYSPTIFLGPLVKALKERSACRSYLIVRDIFPEWAVDMGLMRKGLLYRIFKCVAHYQYSVADTIGAQSPGNIAYFSAWVDRVEVLENWLANAPLVPCRIDLARTALAGRSIFVYAGNMGVAQGVSIFVDLAETLKDRSEFGFLFVGRGSDFDRFRVLAAARGLTNVLFYNEIDPSEIPGLYAQCHVGLVALDPRHKTHNIPGKFLSYMQAGLPVLARVNAGNDLAGMIQDARVGYVSTELSAQALKPLAESLVRQLSTDSGIRQRCRELAMCHFSPEAAMLQIVAALGKRSSDVTSR